MWRTFTKKYGVGMAVVAMLFVIIVPNIVHAQAVYATSWVASYIGALTDKESLASIVTKGVFKTIAEFLFVLGSFALALTGIFLDWVMDFSIVKMAGSINASDGIGLAINESWRTLRDVANMVFIFILLWAAIQTIIDLNTAKFKESIKNIIIVALLINFSLFFTKVVIDASNIAAIGFYKSILTSNGNATLQVAIPGVGDVSLGDFTSIFPRITNIHSFYGNGIENALQDGVKIMITAMMSLLTMLIMSIVFLVIGIMLLARYILLVFLMILSPLALLGYTLPSLKGKFNLWKSAVLNQAFFAPYFMLLMWVAVRILNAVGSDPSLRASAPLAQITKSPDSVMGIILRFTLVIGFMVTALILSKRMAMSSFGFGAIAGGIGAVTIGTAAVVGRNTLGRASRAALNSKDLKNASVEKGFVGGVARGLLKVAHTGSKSSFDARAVSETGLGKALGTKEAFGILGKSGGKDGFDKTTKEKAERKAKYSKEVYGQTSREKDEASEAERDYKDFDKKYKEEKEKEDKKIKAEKEREAKDAENSKTADEKDLEAKRKAYEEMRDARVAGVATADFATEEAAKKSFEEAQEKLKASTLKHQKALEKQRAKIEENEYTEATRALKERADERKAAWEEAKDAHKDRQRAYAQRLSEGAFGTKWMGIFQPNQGYLEAARKVRDQAKGESREKRIAKLLREDSEESGGQENKKGGEGGEENKTESGGEENKTQETT